ncbi:MAG: hypothetical protein WC730_00415 [Patescibacteria group bacterium]|jgi:hypothetical protein
MNLRLENERISPAESERQTSRIQETHSAENAEDRSKRIQEQLEARYGFKKSMDEEHAQAMRMEGSARSEAEVQADKESLKKKLENYLLTMREHDPIPEDVDAFLEAIARNQPVDATYEITAEMLRRLLKSDKKEQKRLKINKLANDPSDERYQDPDALRADRALDYDAEPVIEDEKEEPTTEEIKIPSFVQRARSGIRNFLGLE